VYYNEYKEIAEYLNKIRMPSISKSNKNNDDVKMILKKCVKDLNKI
jgi:hypothetical protein